MLALEQNIIHQTPALHSTVKSTENEPWLILNHHHEKVSYRYDHIAEVMGTEEFNGDGLGLSFQTKSNFYAGQRLSLAFPLPDSIRNYSAYVVSAAKKGSRYEIGIWLPMESKFDLLTILRSCDYLDVRQSS